MAAADRLYRSGVEHHLAERLSQAALDYSRALELVPNHAAVLNNHGGVHLKLADAATSSASNSHRQTAERSLRAATRHAPHNLDAYLNLGVLYKNDGRVVEALAAYSTAAALAPSDSSAHERLGGAHMLAAGKEKHLESALHHATAASSAFTAAIKLAPNDGVAHERRGEALLAVASHHANDPSAQASQEAHTAYAAAVDSLATAVRLQPRAGSAYSKLAIAAHGVGAHGNVAALRHIESAMHHLQLAAHHESRVWQLQPRVIKPAEASSETCAATASAACDVEAWRLERRDVKYDGAELPGGSIAAPGTPRPTCTVRSVGVRIGGGADAEGDGDEGVSTGDGGDIGDGGSRGRGQLLAAFATPLFVHRLPRATALALNRQLLPELLARERQQASVRHSNRGGWQSAPTLLSGDDLPPAFESLRRHILDAAASLVERLYAAASPTRPPRAKPWPPPRMRLSVLNSWANVNRQGHHNLYHDHPQAILSGVYFVDDGQHGDGRRPKGGRHNRTSAVHPGSIELIDPRYSLRVHRPPAQFEPPCRDLGGESHSLRPGYLFEYSPPLQFDPTPGAFLLFPAWLMHRVRMHPLATARVSVSFNVWLADEDGGLQATRRLFDAAFNVAE